jgi:hypothetical protein
MSEVSVYFVLYFEASHLVKIINTYYIKFFIRFRIEKLIKKHGHRFLRLPHIVISIPSGLVQVKGDYNSNTGRNGFGTEAVKKMR